MLDRLSILCFGGTYALALLADLARLRTGGQAYWKLVIGLLGLGWAVHGVYLINHGIDEGRVPVATLFDSLIVLGWILAAIELYLLIRAARPSAVGFFLTPLLLAVVVVGGLVAPRAEWASDWGGPVRFWGAVHGILLTAGAVCTFVAFAAGLMYVAQSRRLKRKQLSRSGLALPSLEQSERINRIAITLSFPMLTFGLLIGVMLNYMVGRSSAGAVLSWTDPKLLSAAAMWCVFAALLHARFRPAMRGRRMMWLTSLAFGFLVFTWVGVGWLVPTAHGTAKPPVKPVAETVGGPAR